MLAYFIIGVILVIGACLEPGIKSPQDRNSFFYFLLLLITMFSAFRYDVGMDYMMYFNTFLGIFESKEKGFDLLLGMYNFLFGKEYGFFFFVATLSIITISCLGIFVKKYSDYKILSLLIFFCFGQYFFLTLNLLRQAFVIYVFLAFFLSFILEKKFLQYVLGLVCMSFFFHKTCLILIPIYFLTKKISLTIKIILLAVFITLPSVIITLISSSSYAIYLEMDMFAAETTILQYFLFVISAFFTVYFTFKQKRKALTKKEILFENINYLNLLFCISMFLFSGTPIMQVCSRLSFYTMPIYIVLIPNYIFNFRIISNRLILRFATVAVFFLIFTVAISTNGETQHLVPYKTIFDLL